MATKYAIQYDSASTVNGKPVGTVYAENIERITYVPDTWSYTRDAREATLFDTAAQAEAAISRWWRNPKVVEVDVS